MKRYTILAILVSVVIPMSSTLCSGPEVEFNTLSALIERYHHEREQVIDQKQKLAAQQLIQASQSGVVQSNGGLLLPELGLLERKIDNDYSWLLGEINGADVLSEQQKQQLRERLKVLNKS